MRLVLGFRQLKPGKYLSPLARRAALRRAPQVPSREAQVYRDRLQGCGVRLVLGFRQLKPGKYLSLLSHRAALRRAPQVPSRDYKAEKERERSFCRLLEFYFFGVEQTTSL